MSIEKENAADKVRSITHQEDKRKNIPTAELQSVVSEEAQAYVKVAYERRNKDLDPQLVWRGKDMADWSDLVVQAPPLYIQEKVQPKVLIDDLMRQSKEKDFEKGKIMADLFADFNGIPHGADKTEFYQHDQHWSNRMILGDSLQVMASLAEKEGLRNSVQCIYFDPPYGIKFNSNFQWSTASRDVKDGKVDHITREPEQVKAFRDTWKDGIHSYLTYLRDRLTVARDLLKDSGSIFVQIGDENVHRVRAVMDEVFGDENLISQITFQTTTGRAGDFLSSASNYILWYSKNKKTTKYRQPLKEKVLGGEGAATYQFVRKQNENFRRLTNLEKLRPELIEPSLLIYRLSDLRSQSGSPSTGFTFKFEGNNYSPGKGFWKSSETGFMRLSKADRFQNSGTSLAYRRYISDYPAFTISNLWDDTGTGSFTEEKLYVVQTGTKVIERCILMATDPGDLVLDPTCGSGTTATVAEQWGRRWITIDTSRVALALAHTRIMGARYPFYLLANSKEGQIKEAQLTKTAPSTMPVHGNIRHGFVYERVPHITLKSIANNTEIDVIWERWQQQLEPLRTQLNAALAATSAPVRGIATNRNSSEAGFWEEWEIPREASESWVAEAKELHAKWWEARITRQREIDASIAAKAEYEYLYDKPYEDKKKVRVARPFTVESISPHRVLGVDENDELIDPAQSAGEGYKSFAEMVLENLKTAGVQQAHKEDKLAFTTLTPWPGELICAEGRYLEGEVEKRAAIFIGPEFGTVRRIDLVDAAREAGDAAFDVLISCAFSYEAHTTDFNKLGRMTILKARMNADLHIAGDLKNTGKGNLFVVFGEPDMEIIPVNTNEIQVKIHGVDVFHPSTGEVRSDGADGIACWFVDTDYNNESFFVRHAYFLGANDPYGSLKTSLKAEINKEVWETLYSHTSRPFPKPATGRIAVKVINHLGDEVMKVFKIS